MGLCNCRHFFLTKVNLPFASGPLQCYIHVHFCSEIFEERKINVGFSHSQRPHGNCALTKVPCCYAPEIFRNVEMLDCARVDIREQRHSQVNVCWSVSTTLRGSYVRSCASHTIGFIAWQSIH